MQMMTFDRLAIAVGLSLLLVSPALAQSTPPLPKAKVFKEDGSDKLPTGLLLQGVTPLEIAERILDGLGMQPLQQIEPTFKCPCTSDRLIRALRLLSPTDVDEILEEEGKVEARCEFCGTVYRMTPEEVRSEMAKATGDASKDSDFYGDKKE